MKNEKKIVKGSVARDVVNKNLKVNSNTVKWSRVEGLWQGLCGR